MINKAFCNLPIALYFVNVIFFIFGQFKVVWYKENYDLLWFIETCFCFIGLVHAFYNWNKYSRFAKSSALTMVAMGLFCVIDVNSIIPIDFYYNVYTALLIGNLFYWFIKK